MRGLGCPGSGGEGFEHPRVLTLLADSPLATALYVAVRAGQSPGFAGALPPLLDWLPSTLSNDVPGEGESAFCGAAAFASVLRIAATNAPHLAKEYRQRLDAADARVDTIVQARLKTARDRLQTGTRPARAEFSLRQGLTGLGMCLLQRPDPGPQLRDLLDYLVELVSGFGGTGRPGWWVDDSPLPDLSDRQEWPHGHADLTLPDGSAGILALLSLAWCDGVRVPGMDVAIKSLAEWYRRHLRTDERGDPWWPEVVTDPEPVTRPELHLREASQLVPGWCGGLGIARSVQLAGIALGDRDLRDAAVAAARAALLWEFPEFFRPGLCHGPQGAEFIALRMAADESDDDACRLLGAAAAMRAITHDVKSLTVRGGLLDGSLGVLVSQASNEARTVLPPTDSAQWDCLLGITTIRASSRAVPARPSPGKSPQDQRSRTSASARAAPSMQPSSP